VPVPACNDRRAQTILTIINVYLNQNRFNGYSGTDLADDLGLSQASASRNVMLWSKLTRKKDVRRKTDIEINESGGVFFTFCFSE